MEKQRKSYLCRYTSAGMEYSCRINARSADEAAAIMRGLPWGLDSGPVGLPRRHYQHLDNVINYAVACLTQARQRLGSASEPQRTDGSVNTVTG